MKSSTVVRQIDIARHLNISRSTVACALTQSTGKKRYRLKAETEELIKKTAAELGYKPSFLGLGLRKRKSFLVGQLNRSVNNWVNADVQRGIQEVLIQDDYAPIVFTHSDLADEKVYLATCIERHVEGLLVNCAVSPDGSTNVSAFAQLFREGLPLVEIFGRYIKAVPSVAIDYEAAGALAVEKLFNMGHRRIAIYLHNKYNFGEDGRTYWTTSDLYRGYCAAMEKRGLPCNLLTFPFPEDLTVVNAIYKAAFGAAQGILSHPSRPTAFVAESPPTALAILDYVMLHERARTDEIHAACLGSHQLISRSTANLTLLANPSQQVGKAAALLLMKMIEDKAAGKLLRRYADIMIAPEG